VSNLDVNTTKEDLQKMFEVYGEIESTFIPLDKVSNGTTFGFVSFKKPADAAKAIEQMNKKPLPNGNILIVNKHVSRKQNELRGNVGDTLTPIAQQMKKTFDANIFINYIPLNVSDKDILDKFRAFGTILQSRVWQKENTNNKRANILYSKVEEA
jgi:polyadenylate-binding protein